MKKTLWAILLLILCNSCRKEDSKLKPAVILGYDLTNCACCGGLLVNFDDNDTISPYHSTIYLGELANDPIVMPADIKYPMKVYIEWTPDTLYYCGGHNRIIISKMIKR